MQVGGSAQEALSGYKPDQAIIMIPVQMADKDVADALNPELKLSHL